jgi:hypothetical protein
VPVIEGTATQSIEVRLFDDELDTRNGIADMWVRMTSMIGSEAVDVVKKKTNHIGVVAFEFKPPRVLKNFAMRLVAVDGEDDNVIAHHNVTFHAASMSAEDLLSPEHAATALDAPSVPLSEDDPAIMSARDLTPPPMLIATPPRRTTPVPPPPPPGASPRTEVVDDTSEVNELLLQPLVTGKPGEREVVVSDSDIMDERDDGFRAPFQAPEEGTDPAGMPIGNVTAPSLAPRAEIADDTAHRTMITALEANLAEVTGKLRTMMTGDYTGALRYAKQALEIISEIARTSKDIHEFERQRTAEEQDRTAAANRFYTGQESKNETARGHWLGEHRLALAETKDSLEGILNAWLVQKDSWLFEKDSVVDRKIANLQVQTVAGATEKVTAILDEHIRTRFVGALQREIEHPTHGWVITFVRKLMEDQLRESNAQLAAAREGTAQDLLALEAKRTEIANLQLGLSESVTFANSAKEKAATVTANLSDAAAQLDAKATKVAAGLKAIQDEVKAGVDKGREDLIHLAGKALDDSKSRVIAETDSEIKKLRDKALGDVEVGAEVMKAEIGAKVAKDGAELDGKARHIERLSSAHVKAAVDATATADPPSLWPVFWGVMAMLGIGSALALSFYL